jgi:glycine dehydrogenase
MVIVNWNGNRKCFILDESTAAAEAMALLDAIKRPKKNNVCKFFVSEEILPQTSVLQTRSAPIGLLW